MLADIEIVPPVCNASIFFIIKFLFIISYSYHIIFLAIYSSSKCVKIILLIQRTLI
ncbi:hypothetical protein IV86_GL001294 [Pediococcus pentosaceus]|nr:hypothetical protein IV86_GL001294 [Pediococcus pentosaceus]